MARRRKNTTGLPEAELDSIARVLYSSIIEYCNSEKGKKDYAEWQKQQLNNKIFNEDMPVESKGQPR